MCTRSYMLHIVLRKAPTKTGETSPCICPGTKGRQDSEESPSAGEHSHNPEIRAFFRAPRNVGGTRPAGVHYSASALTRRAVRAYSGRTDLEASRHVRHQLDESGDPAATWPSLIEATKERKYPSAPLLTTRSSQSARLPGSRTVEYYQRAGQSDGACKECIG